MDSEIIEIIDLHPYEVNIIKIFRNIGFGRVTIILQNGLPLRAEEAIRFHNPTVDTSKGNVIR